MAYMTLHSPVHLPIACSSTKQPHLDIHGIAADPGHESSLDQRPGSLALSCCHPWDREGKDISSYKEATPSSAPVGLNAVLHHALS